MRLALVAFALLRLGLRLEGGPEYDSNANHVRTPAPGSSDVSPTPSWLARLTARGRLDWKDGKGSALRLTLDLGGRLFFDGAARPQDVLVARLGAEARTTVGARTTLGLALDYHDAFQYRRCDPFIITDERGQLFADDSFCHRDFRLASLRGTATVRDGAPAITFEAAARGYQWKPDADLSFAAASFAAIPSLLLRTGGDDEHEWSASVAGRVEWRRYAGRALASATDLAPDQGGPRRTDTVVSLAATLSYFGPLFASAGWLIEADRSTSFDGSYLYQALTLETAMPMGAGLMLGARAQLLFFENGFLPRSLSVEDENRNSFMVDLSRDFAYGLSLRARYALYRSAAGDEGQGYERHLGSLLLTFQPR